MEAKINKCKVIHKPPNLPCIWFQVPLSEALNEFKMLEDKTLDGYILTLKKKREKSLNANAYMWQLCEKIAVKIDATKEDVYREAIRHVGVFFDNVLDKKMADDLIVCWSRNGIGWFAENIAIMGEAAHVRMYKGSSIYDGEEMRRLVDYVVSEAQNLGIETMTPTEIERLNQLWDGD